MLVNKTKDGQYTAKIELKTGEKLEYTAETPAKAIMWLLWKVKKHTRRYIPLAVN